MGGRRKNPPREKYGDPVRGLLESAPLLRVTCPNTETGRCMLNAAMVLMILAGIFGLPAVACSAACAALGTVSGADQSAAEGQAIMEALKTAGMIASAGSILVGALVKRLGRAVSGVAALLFALIFGALILQANVLGLVSSGMLLVAAVMIFVTPEQQFRSVTRVETS
jgi:hypothetical protein